MAGTNAPDEKKYVDDLIARAAEAEKQKAQAPDVEQLQLRLRDNETLFLDERKKSIRQEEEIKDLEIKLQGLKNEAFAQDTKDRWLYTRRIFRLTGYWLFGIFLMVLLSGQGTLKFPDAVLVALITTTTINVIGLCYIVANYLFPRSNKDGDARPVNEVPGQPSKQPT